MQCVSDYATQPVGLFKKQRHEIRVGDVVPPRIYPCEYPHKAHGSKHCWGQQKQVVLRITLASLVLCLLLGQPPL